MDDVTFIDISSWQATADLAAYRKLYSRISLRAGDGPNYTDPTFAPRWAQAAQLQFQTRMAYHFARPGDPRAQTDAFLGRVHAAGGWRAVGDIAMLDTEWFSIASAAAQEQLDGDTIMLQGRTPHAGSPETGVLPNAEHFAYVHPEARDRDPRGVTWVGLPPEQALNFIKVFRDEVHRDNPDVGIIMYGNSWYFNDARVTQSSVPGIGSIIAAYGPGYALPVGWDHACGWQFTDNMRVPGLASGVDANRVTCPQQFHHLFPDNDGDLTVAQAQQILDAVNFLIGAQGQANAKVLNAVAFETSAVGKRFDDVAANQTKIMDALKLPAPPAPKPARRPARVVAALKEADEILDAAEAANKQAEAAQQASARAAERAAE